ncbi:MAG: nucleoside hydrolase [Victivallales bacterium]|nr:nucleoside hydrolase [Victivallales bacterium]
MNRHLLSTLILSSCIAMGQVAEPKEVILDTDIIGDIDDTWALGMLLNSPELDLKLISTGTGNPLLRAKCVAKMLTQLKRTDIPIAVGLYSSVNALSKKQLCWSADYDLTMYQGDVDFNGIDAIIETLENSDEPTLICIGPLANIQQVCLRRPDLCEKTNLVAMAGSVYKGYTPKQAQAAVAEWNVKCQIPEAQTVFSANWKSITITPLDTCGFVRLKGERYQRMKDSQSPVAKMIVENYRHWLGKPDKTDETESSVLFDTVAVYLSYTHDNLVMKKLNIEIDDQGIMRLDTPKAKPMLVAVDWVNLDAYEEYLVKRLTK